MEKQVQDILESLSSIEKKVLPFIELGNLEAIHEKSNIEKGNINKAMQLFSQKNLIKLNSESKNLIHLDVNGVDYKKRGLPERRLLDALVEKCLPLEEAKKQAELSDNELAIAIGILKKKNLIKFEKNAICSFTKKDEAMKKFPEEKFIEVLPLEIDKLNNEQKDVYEKLKSRKKILVLEEEKKIDFQITELGKKVLNDLDKAPEMIEQLTPEIIKDEKWKNKRFRGYDLNIKVPRISGGKRHPYLKFLDDVKKELTSLGFEEAQGPIVESNFFNCDSLFMPQNHPARGIHDLYFIDGRADLKKYREKIKDVSETHKNGWKTGSDGWNYKFNEEETEKLVLRSQGTAISSRILANKPKIPGKYFSIARVFRPDILDSSHLTEFNQLEGIVISKDVNLKHLFGLLKLFAEKIAKTNKIKLVPGYFPFTEPSVELQAEFNGKWLELGGAGIFRPEVTLPLGLDKDTKVLAWGLGIDRLFMIKENISDIRELFSQDLNFLRRI